MDFYIKIDLKESAFCSLRAKFWVFLLHAVTVVHLLSGVWLFPAPQTAAHQVPLSSAISWSLFKLHMGTNHFISLHLWFKFYRRHPTSVCVLCKFPGGSGCSLRRRVPLSMHLHLVMDVSITSCRCGWRLILRGKQRQAVAGRAVGMLWLRWMSPEGCLEPKPGNRDPKRSSQMDNSTMFPCPATRVSFRCCWQHPGLKVRWTWPSLWWDLLKNLTLMLVFEHLLLLTAASSLPLSWKLPEGTDCLWASVNGGPEINRGVDLPSTRLSASHTPSLQDASPCLLTSWTFSWLCFSHHVNSCLMCLFLFCCVAVKPQVQ